MNGQNSSGTSCDVFLTNGETLPHDVFLAHGETLPYNVYLADGETLPHDVFLADGDTLFFLAGHLCRPQRHCSRAARPGIPHLRPHPGLIPHRGPMTYFWPMGIHFPMTYFWAMGKYFPMTYFRPMGKHSCCVFLGDGETFPHRRPVTPRGQEKG